MLCFVVFWVNLLPHLCPNLVCVGKRRSRIWKGREDVLLARNWQGLRFPLHQYAGPVGWRWVLTFWLLSGPVNSHSLIFTERFTGCKEGEAGDLLSGALLSNEPSSLCSFSSFPSVSLVNELLDSLGRMEKGSLRARHEKAEGS